MLAYYNEFDPAAAHILRYQVASQTIAFGDVDARSIKDVSPDDLRGYAQCHFFAGGGLWSVAARLAGWPDDKPLWTGSCPCQGESVAGKRLGAADPRHLWPDFRRLIRACRPPVVVGEQVAAAIGSHWLDGTLSDLDADGYAARAVSIPACAVDAPHQRDRVYWVAVSSDAARERRSQALGKSADGVAADVEGSADRIERARSVARRDVESDADSRGRGGRQESAQRGALERTAAERTAGELFADADKPIVQGQPSAWQLAIAERDARALRNGSFWSDAEWIISPIDGKARRSKPGIRFLVDGLPGRVDLWRVGGNAIVPILAAEVLAALMETI